MAMTPERLADIEHWAQVNCGTIPGTPMAMVLDLIAEIRRLTADLASAHADADAWRRSTRAVEAERDAAVEHSRLDREAVENGLRREDALTAEIVALTDAREHMQAERDAAVAQAQASGQAEATLRGALRQLLDLQIAATPEEHAAACGAARAALVLTPTAAAEAVRELVEAAREALNDFGLVNEAIASQVMPGLHPFTLTPRGLRVALRPFNGEGGECWPPEPFVGEGDA